MVNHLESSQGLGAVSQEPQKLQIQLTCSKILPPTVIPDQYQSVLLRHELPTVFPEFLLMILPHPVMKLPRCPEYRLIMEMKITDCIKSHLKSPLFFLTQFSYSVIVSSNTNIVYSILVKNRKGSFRNRKGLSLNAAAPILGSLSLCYLLRCLLTPS